jgi:hypothetical protein
VIPDAQLAYEAYAEAVGWKAVDRSDLPHWNDLDGHIKAGWEAAASAINNNSELVDLRTPAERTQADSPAHWAVRSEETVQPARPDTA